MTDKHAKIIKLDDTLGDFAKKIWHEESIFKLFTFTITAIPKTIALWASRPFRNYGDYNAYTTQEKLNWHQAKGKAINNQAYHNLSDYIEAPEFQKTIAKSFSSFAAHKIAENVAENAKDYSNDPNIVPVPKPKPFFSKGKKLNRPQN